MQIPPLKLIALSVILSFSGSWHLGYETTCMNPSELVLKRFLNDTHYETFGEYLTLNSMNFKWSAILMATNYGGIIGTIASSPLMEKLGRKLSFFVMVAFCGIGPLLCALAYTFRSATCFAVGRLVSGFGVGISMSLLPTYFAEISPAEYRGFLSCFTGAFVQLGLLFGAIFALPTLLGTTDLWPLLFYVEMIPNIIAILFVPFLRESPKYIMAKHKDRKLAAKLLAYFGHKNVEAQLTSIEEEIAAEKSTLGLRGLMKHGYLRKGLSLACLVQFSSAFSGVIVINFMSTRLFVQAGVNSTIASYATVGMTCLCTIAAILSCFTVDKIGRKPLIIATLLACGLVDLIFAVFAYISRTTNTQWASYICVIAIYMFAFVYGLGPSAVSWFLASELVPQNARSTTTIVAVIVLYVSCVFIIFAYSALEAMLAEWTFLIFIIAVTLTSAYFWKVLPETMNRETSEIIKILGYKRKQSLIDGDNSNEKETKQL